MPSRERLASIADHRARRIIREFGEMAREQRMAQGLSRRALVSSLPFSESKLARWELGRSPYPDLYEAAMLMRMLGHDLTVQSYPAGSGLRDAPHAKLTARFVGLVPRSVPRRLEVPVARNDLRAWDVVLYIGPVRVGVAVETRLRDFQSLLRREQLKQRDSGVERLLFVLLDSRTNHRRVAEAGAALRQALPLDGRAIWPALRSGRDPGGNGIVFL
jgi:transcriptional regulator with XRE-family HTH domain